MPRLLKGLRQRGRSFFLRVRTGGVDRTIPLGRDLDRAVTRALEIRRRIQAGLPPTEERTAILTLRDAVHSWLEDHVRHTRHGAFAGNTRSRCERVLLPFMGDHPLDQVTAGTLFAYRNHLVGLTSRRGRPLSAATVRMFLGDVRAVLNHALTLQVLDRSPIPRGSGPSGCWSGPAPTRREGSFRACSARLPTTMPASSPPRGRPTGAWPGRPRLRGGSPAPAAAPARRPASGR